MIPAIIMCCVKDVEERGIDEVGIYRVPGNECHANEILDKFTRVNINLIVTNESDSRFIQFQIVSQLITI